MRTAFGDGKSSRFIAPERHKLLLVIKAQNPDTVGLEPEWLTCAASLPIGVNS